MCKQRKSKKKTGRKLIHVFWAEKLRFYFPEPDIFLCTKQSSNIRSGTFHYVAKIFQNVSKITVRKNVAKVLQA